MARLLLALLGGHQQCNRRRGTTVSKYPDRSSTEENTLATGAQLSWADSDPQK